MRRYKQDHPEGFQIIPNATARGYFPPKVNREDGEKLKDLYRRIDPEEFPNRRKSLPKGYPVNPPGNLSQSRYRLPSIFIPWKYIITMVG
jgi:hypothetical protein